MPTWIEEIMYRFTADFSDLRDATRSVSSQLDKVSRAFNSAEHKMSSFSLKARNVSGSLSLLGKTLGAITAIKLGDWFAKSMKESISFVENLNLFTVAMGESVEEGKKFVDTMSEIYGMDPSNLYRYTGYFYQLTDAIGMTDEASSILSLSLTKASNDIASLFNMPIEQVVDNLASGMQGISKAVRKYGMDIRSVTLQETAHAYGIDQKVAKMSEADRQALRYLTMMQQVKNATNQLADETGSASGVMGDFARNIETPANQLRIFKEQITQLGRAIGNFFIPMLRKVLPILNGIIMALRTVLTFIATITGIDLNFGGTFSGAADTASDLAGAVEDVAEEAEDANKQVKKLKNTVLGFDELNLLQEPTESSGKAGKDKAEDITSEGLNPVLLDAIKNMKLDLEDIKMKANQVRDAILEFLGFGWEDGQMKWYPEKFEENLVNKFPQWEKTIHAVFANWTDIVDGFKNVLSALGEVVDEVKKKIKEWVDSLQLDEKFSKAIEELPGKLNNLADWIREHKSEIADFVILLGKIYLGFRVFSMITKFVAPLIRVGSAIAGLIGPISSFVATLLQMVAPLLAVAGVIALLWTNSESFAESFKNLFSTLVGSFAPIADSVQTLANRIWESLQQLWVNNIQPMIASIGDALAPILDTVSVFVDVATQLIQGFIDMLGNIWDATVAPLIASISAVIYNLMTIIKDLWETTIGPVVEHILESLPDLWTNTIQPIIEKIIDIIGNLCEIVLSLWNNFLAPLADFWIKELGPVISQVMNDIWDIVSQVFSDIGVIIDGFLEALQGLTDFIAGVFTNDWNRALRGLLKIFTGVLNAISGVVQSVVNAIISVVNTVIRVIWSSIQSFVNGLIHKINRIGRYVGINIGVSWDSPPPAIGYISIPKVYANGGFPEDGLFFANHNELVGEFTNGKTAVANNRDIQAGIEEASYRGFTRALSTVGSIAQNNSGRGTVIFNVNGREFARAIYDDFKAVEREQGFSMINNFA